MPYRGYPAEYVVLWFGVVVEADFRDSQWKEVLGAAALIDDLTVAAMSAAAAIPPEMAVRIHDDAVAAGIIRRGQLNAEAAADLVDELSPDRYAAIHAEAARYYARGSATEQLKAIVLARRAAGVVSHAELVAIIDAAAGAVMADGDFAQAVDLFAEADGLDPERSSIQRARRLVSWAEGAEFTGDTVTAGTLRVRAFDLAEAAGDASLMTTIAVDHSTPPGWRFGDDNAHRMVSRSERLVSDDGDRARLTATRAMLSIRVPADPGVTSQIGWVTQASVAQPLADEALILATDCDDDAELLALLAWRTTHTGPTWLARRTEASQEAIELAQGLGQPDRLVQACTWAAVDAIERCDVVSLDRTVTIARWAAERSRIPRALWYSHVLQAGRALMTGDAAEATAHQAEALRIGQAANLPGTLSAELVFTSQLVLARDDHDEIAGLCMAAAHPLLAGLVGRVCNAMGLARTGQFDHARRDLAVTMRWMDDESSLLFMAVLAARAAIDIGDEEPMRQLITRLTPWSHHIAVDSNGWWCVGPVSLTLAELHHAVGDTDVARPLVAEAAFAAERLHDRRSLQRAQALWAEIGVEPQSPGSQVESARLNSLTERERTVLQLLAQGQTNPDIANQLAYSLATVRRDTITIYRKLGVGGRVAATAIAIAEGLVGDDGSTVTADRP